MKRRCRATSCGTLLLERASVRPHPPSYDWARWFPPKGQALPVKDQAERRLCAISAACELTSWLSKKLSPNRAGRGEEPANSSGGFWARECSSSSRYPRAAWFLGGAQGEYAQVADNPHRGGVAGRRGGAAVRRSGRGSGVSPKLHVTGFGEQSNPMHHRRPYTAARYLVATSRPKLRVTKAGGHLATEDVRRA